MNSGRARATAAGPELSLDLVERRRLTKPALRAFFRIAEVWKLTRDQQMALLGRVSPVTLRRWRRGGVTAVSSQTLERISLTLRIFAAIDTLLPDPAKADRWVQQPNSARLFGGASAVDFMCSGIAEMRAVVAYLEAQTLGEMPP